MITSQVIDTTRVTYENLREFHDWLRQNTPSAFLSAPPVGISTRTSSDGTLHLVFATKEKAYYLVLTRDPNDLIAASLRTVFHAKDRPLLSSNDAYTDIINIYQRVPKLDLDTVCRTFWFDVPGLADAAGVTLQLRSTERMLDVDAVDAAMNGPQLSSALQGTQAEKWYLHVYRPWVWWMARKYLGKLKKKERKFIVKYDDLFWKMLGFFSNDPGLIELFRDEDHERPEAHFARKLNIREEEVLPFFVWLLIGENLEKMREQYPHFLKRLPDKPEMLKYSVADRVIPVIRLWIAEELEYGKTGHAQHFVTVAGRMPKSRVPSDMLIRKVIGSIDDVELIAIATLLELGNEIDEVSWGADWHDFTIIGYTDSDDMERQQDILNFGGRFAPINMGAKVVVT